MPSDRDIILEPIISEKSVQLKKQNKYVFKVDWKVNSTEIGKSIEEKFKTKVAKVNILKMPGKKKEFREILWKNIALEESNNYSKKG